MQVVYSQCAHWVTVIWVTVVMTSFWVTVVVGACWVTVCMLGYCMHVNFYKVLIMAFGLSHFHFWTSSFSFLDLVVFVTNVTRFEGTHFFAL